MKKTLKKLFIVLLALGFVVGFASCKKATGDNNGTEQNGNSDTTQQGGDNNGGDNNGGDNNGGNEQGGDNNGGSTTAAGAYYSYEITSGEVTYTFDKDGKLTGKADGSALEDTDTLMESSFISIKLDKDIANLGASGKYTSFFISGAETVLTDDDPETAAMLAEMYTYTYENGTLTILASGAPMAEITVGSDGSITYVNGGLTYKFKKA